VSNWRQDTCKKLPDAADLVVQMIVRPLLAYPRESTGSMTAAVRPLRCESKT